MEHVYRRRLPPLPRGVLREDEACAVAWQTTEKPGVVFLRVARLPKPRNDRFWPVLFSKFGFLFLYPTQEPCGVNGFSYIFTPPTELASTSACKGRFRASASACRGDFVQVQALARTISCKRKCLQGRFRASASACRGDFVQAQALARNHPRKPICLHKAPRPPAL